ncbi:MAG TPA: TetR/AcrR family transcriptional regulator [Solirubrobacterales bacterium]|nr:TetR/AcrR family transcriptional regulator [Solirubrobacterales bacterium]
MTDESPDLRKWRLPRGRHGLPRELVVRSQRERLLAAVVRVTAAKGYEAMSVADILAEAGVGRESFYDLFEDKRDCALAAHTVLLDHLETSVRAIYDEPGPWEDRVRKSVAAMLEWFASDPAAARFTIVELAALGPESRDRFQEVFQRYSQILEEGREGSAAPDPERPQAAALAISAGLARVYEEVVRGRTTELPNLLPQMTYEVLVPFIGEEAARAEERRAAEMLAAG